MLPGADVMWAGANGWVGTVNVSPLSKGSEDGL